MKHYDDENVYEANFKISKTLSLVTTSLTQNWVKKDLNLYQHDIQSESFDPILR